MRDVTDQYELQDGERAFKTDDGLVVCVRFTRAPVPEGSPFVALKTWARVLDEDGGTLMVGGSAAKVCLGVRSVHANALVDDGPRTLEGEMAEATTRAIEAMHRHLTALRAWARLPTDQDSGG